MWHIQNLNVRESIFPPCIEEFPPVPTLEVFSGDICLINAVSLCDFSTDPCQLEICQCGQTGCNSTGWVSFRRVNDFVLMIPSFRHLIDRDEFERTHYRPPSTFTSPDMSGAISVSDYSELVRQVPDLPSPHTIHPPLRSEFLRIAQLQAPLQALGRYPEKIALNRELLIAVAEGELADEVRCLDNQLMNAIQNDGPVTSADCNDTMRPIKFYLDGPGFPEWAVFQRSNRELHVDLPIIGPVRL